MGFYFVKRCPRCLNIKHNWRKVFGAIGFCETCLMSLWREVTQPQYRHLD